MMEFVTNNNGIRFLICCASCENRVLEVTGSRCGLARTKPKRGKQCTAYRFRQSLMYADKAMGRIKNPYYLRFLLEWRDRETMQCVPLQNRASLLEIRSEYEKKYGSIYLTP